MNIELWCLLTTIVHQNFDVINSEISLRSVVRHSSLHTLDHKPLLVRPQIAREREPVNVVPVPLPRAVVVRHSVAQF